MSSSVRANDTRLGADFAVREIDGGGTGAPRRPCGDELRQGHLCSSNNVIAVVVSHFDAAADVGSGLFSDNYNNHNSTKINIAL